MSTAGMLSKSHPAESLAQLLVRCSLAVKDTFVQPYDTALCSLARETADYAGRAKVKAVECHGRPVRLAPHKSKSSKGFKSRLSAPRHLHAPTSTAHSPLPPSPASVASQTEVAYPASLHRQAESTLAQPSQLSSHVGELEQRRRRSTNNP